MHKLKSLLIVTLLFYSVAQARTIPTAVQNEAPKPAQETPELIEAHKLSAEAVKLYNRRKFDEALPLAKRVVELREKVLGKDDKLIGDAYNNLGAIYMGKKDYRESESAFRKALEIYQKNLGENSPKLLFTISNLGWATYANANLVGAKELFKRSVTINEVNSGQESAAVIQPLYTLAEFCQRTGQYDEAVAYYKRVLAVMEKAGAVNKELAYVAERCACVLTISKKPEEAVEFRNRARALHAPPKSAAPQPLPNPEDLVIPNNLGGLIVGNATYRAEPAYPAAAKQARISGAVIVEVTINEEGKVIGSRALCGHDALSPAAEAARQLLFKPTILSGQPTKAIGTITFNFNL
jgi:TonB family protein